MSKHCADINQDRDKGALWERNFCQILAENGRVFTPLQIGRESSAQCFFKELGVWHHSTLPDITVWTAPGEYHEIKHKNTTKFGTFGLEQYRFEALKWFANETGQKVFYTIHNHGLSGGSNSNINHIDHWITADILDLDEKWTIRCYGDSWINGVKKKTPIYYWHKNLWRPLREIIKL